MKFLPTQSANIRLVLIIAMLMMTTQSYIFLANGRFAYEGWLYETSVDANEWIGEPLNEAQLRTREASVRHYQMWGKYRIIAGNDPVQGETIELTFQDGSHMTAQVVNGHACFQSKHS